MTIAFGLTASALRSARPFSQTNRARLLLSDQWRVDAKPAFRLLCSPKMKGGDRSARKVACRALFALGCFVFIQVAGQRGARAESARKVGGFEALGMLGYGVAVGDLKVRDTEVAPYGVMVGLDLGYTLPFGLRIGADVSKGFGRRIEETQPTGEVVVTDVSSSSFGGSIGYDLLLPLFRLRGAADLGMFLYDGQGGYIPGASYYIGPKVALIWQYHAFELGLQSKYLLTSADGPDNHGVVQVGLMSGARF